ncbi:MAG: hypothetical protein ACKV2V_11260 [Blastocatellia bacterium]
MTICEACGFESPVSARFCRQCGVLLQQEQGMSEAPTRNYGRQETPMTGGLRAPSAFSAASGPLPPSIGDAIGGTTARYPQPAPAPYAPPSFQSPAPLWAPPVKATSRLKSIGKRLFLGGAFLSALLIAGGIGAAINHEATRARVYLTPQERSQLERVRREDDMDRRATESVQEYSDRLTEQMNRRMEDIDRAIEDARRSLERGAMPVPDQKPLSLHVYEYENAAGGQFSRLAGREFVTQQSRDAYDAISQFYVGKMGQPIAQTRERNNRKTVFQTADSPSVTVLLEENDERRGQTKITILRSPFTLQVLRRDPLKTSAPAPPAAVTEAPAPPPPAPVQKQGGR